MTPQEEKRARKAEYDKEWRRRNPDKTRAYRARWYAANPHKAAAANRRRYLANPEKERARQQVWRAANPERMQAYSRREAAKRSGYLTDTCGPTKAELQQAQSGRCKICGDASLLVLDHCHLSGYRRGLLCHSCNVALGMLKDSPARILKMLKYLCDTGRRRQELEQAKEQIA